MVPHGPRVVNMRTEAADCRPEPLAAVRRQRGRTYVVFRPMAYDHATRTMAAWVLVAFLALLVIFARD